MIRSYRQLHRYNSTCSGTLTNATTVSKGLSVIQGVSCHTTTGFSKHRHLCNYDNIRRRSYYTIYKASGWMTTTEPKTNSTKCLLSTVVEPTNAELPNTSTVKTETPPTEDSSKEDISLLSSIPATVSLGVTYELPILPKLSVETITQPSDPQYYRNRTLVSKLGERMSITGEQFRIRCGQEFYQAIIRQSMNPEWYQRGRLKNAFRQRHALIVTHLWLIHKRLVTDEYDIDRAKLIQKEMFDFFWDDATCRMRREGIYELSVNKELGLLQRSTFYHLSQYDNAYNEYYDKPVQRLQELRKIVFQQIFQRDPSVEFRYDHLDRFVWYIDSNYQNIMFQTPYDDFKEARLAWTNLPDFTNIIDSDGETILPEFVPLTVYDRIAYLNERKLARNNRKRDDDHNKDDQMVELPEGWLRHITLDGYIYYWNPETRQRAWDRKEIMTVEEDLVEDKK